MSPSNAPEMESKQVIILSSTPYLFAFLLLPLSNPPLFFTIISPGSVGDTSKATINLISEEEIDLNYCTTVVYSEGGKKLKDLVSEPY